MDLPVMPPVRPMLAKSVKGIPDPAKYDGLSFEPKWDGFRAIVYAEGEGISVVDALIVKRDARAARRTGCG